MIYIEHLLWYKILTMKTYLGCVLLLLVFFIGCSCPPVEPAPSLVPSPTPIPPPSPVPTPPPVIEPDAKYTIQLARQFCPIIHLKGEPETLENFEPDPVQIMIDMAMMRDSENPSFSEEATISNLLKWSQSPYYIDLIDLNPKEHSPAEYKKTYDILKQTYKPTVYARVNESDSSGHTIVQYWLFITLTTGVIYMRATGNWYSSIFPDTPRKNW